MTGLTTDHAHWLEDERHIPVEIAAQAGVISHKGAVGFPYLIGGRAAFAKFRTPDKTRFWIEPSGQPLVLWNLDSLADASGSGETVIVAEGELDGLSWLTAAQPYVTSVPSGAPSKPGEGDIDPHQDSQFSYLWKGGQIHPDIAKFSRVVLSTDADGPGQILRDELAIRIGRDKCWVVDYPDDCKDANDVLKRHGVAGLLEVLGRARPIVPNRLVSFSEIPERATREIYSTGWSGLDPHMMIAPPELMVITGVPGAGKSQWALALCANLARIHGLKGAIMQFEDNPDRNRRDLKAYARAWQTATHAAIADEPDVWVDRMFRTIAPSEQISNDVDFDLKWVHTAIHEAVCRHGCRWVLIDPWNEIEHVWRVNENETAYTNQALRELKRIARRYQILLIVVTHPSKGVNGKPVDEVNLYDISGSAAWRNKADHGVIIYRETPTSQETIIKIDKSKDWTIMGFPGSVVMRYAPQSRTFECIGRAC